MHRAYTTRLNVTKKQDVALRGAIAQLCELYNMALEQRKHDCNHRGLSLGRDHNASINILQRGMRCVAQAA